MKLSIRKMLKKGILTLLISTVSFVGFAQKHNVVNASIEVKRSTKEIVSSLEADVQIYLGEEYLKLVKNVNLSEYFITSNASAKPMINDDKLFKLDEVNNVKVLVTKAKGKKCSRCWKILENPCQRNNCGLKN